MFSIYLFKPFQRFSVFLSNLAFNVEEAPIQAAMSTSGNVVEVRLIRNPLGKSKGFAYVEFSTEAEARFCFASPFFIVSIFASVLHLHSVRFCFVLIISSLCTVGI